MALILNLYSAILLGILYLFFGAFPFVFEGIYGFNLWQTGLTFLGMLLGMFSGAMMSGVWVKVRVRLMESNARITGVEGKSEPEFRLPPVIVGSAFVTIGLFWFAWTTLSWVHWILPIIGSAIFGCGVSSSPPCPPTILNTPAGKTPCAHLAAYRKWYRNKAACAGFAGVSFSNVKVLGLPIQKLCTALRDKRHYI